MPIKILFISHRSDIGGGELSLFDLVLWLHLKKKIIPYIILSEKGGLYDKFKDAGFHVELVPLPPLKKIKISSIINIIRIVKKNSINVIHANTTRAAMYSVFAKIFLNVKFVWHNRGTDKRGIFEYILSLFTDKLIAISHSVKSGLINAGVNPKKISVIYNGINLDLYNKNSDKKKRNIHPEITKNNKNIISQKKYNIGLIGRFTSEKGHKYLINAADLIINKYNFKNINFKFIGNDNFGISVLGDIKKNIAEYNLEKYFEFTGYVESIVEYINDNLDVIVIPSEREAFGRVVLESWIAEKPVIAFEIEGLAELIENNKTGILVKKNNVIELAEKIMYIINNQHAAKNIVLSGKEEIKKFDISFSSENILKVWEEIII